MTFTRIATLLAAGVIVARSAQAQAGSASKFSIKVENISKGEVLKLSNGRSAPFVSAPVLWVTSTGNTNPIFSGGKPDAGWGLEQLAETGNPSTL
ncbi:MAG TPA: hypothetical protein VFX42_06975, partial [Gemmatimonadales bacterium]|nr:hypothetical protein [Gemmatimonadales bacterium]